MVQALIVDFLARLVYISTCHQ